MAFPIQSHSPFNYVQWQQCNDLEDNSCRDSICQELKEDLEKIVLHCKFKNVVTLLLKMLN